MASLNKKTDTSYEWQGPFTIGIFLHKLQQILPGVKDGIESCSLNDCTHAYIYIYTYTRILTFIMYIYIFMEFHQGFFS